MASIPYPLLIIIAIFMAMAPFQPEPHLWQKFQMLLAGTLHKPMDVFDVCWHLLPSALLLTKWMMAKKD